MLINSILLVRIFEANERLRSLPSAAKMFKQLARKTRVSVN